MADPRSPSKRPDGKDYTKWESPLPKSLEDFMNHYIAYKQDGEELADWKRDIVLTLESELKEMIRQHWKASSKTRKLFIAMNKDEVWIDQKALDMHLTKRNLATLDPKFIPELDDQVLRTTTKLVEDLRHEMLSILDATYASDEERGEVTPLTSGSEPENYYFEEYKNHLDLVDTLRQEFKSKFGAIETLRKRELWVQNLVKFEGELKAPRQSKGKKDYSNWIPRFRADAAKILERANRTATEVIAEYESATGKTFLILGQNYLEDYLKPQKAQVARVKTNFSHLSADILFFDNPGGGQEGEPICGKICDGVLEGLVSEGVPERDPPPMPSCSDELEFTFAYY